MGTKLAKVKDEFDLSHIKPLVTKLPPVMKPAAYLSYNECVKESEKLREQMNIILNLPKVGDEKPEEYMHDVLELIRRRFIEMNWRTIELQSLSSKKLANIRMQKWLKWWEGYDRDRKALEEAEAQVMK